jgi:hypothetical protein
MRRSPLLLIFPSGCVARRTARTVAMSNHYHIVLFPLWSVSDGEEPKSAKLHARFPSTLCRIRSLPFSGREKCRVTPSRTLSAPSCSLGYEGLTFAGR